MGERMNSLEKSLQELLEDAEPTNVQNPETDTNME